MSFFPGPPFALCYWKIRWELVSVRALFGIVMLNKWNKVCSNIFHLHVTLIIVWCEFPVKLSQYLFPLISRYAPSPQESPEQSKHETLYTPCWRQQCSTNCWLLGYPPFLVHWYGYPLPELLQFPTDHDMSLAHCLVVNLTLKHMVSEFRPQFTSSSSSNEYKSEYHF